MDNIFIGSEPGEEPLLNEDRRTDYEKLCAELTRLREVEKWAREAAKLIYGLHEQPYPAYILLNQAKSLGLLEDK